jgi:thioredoxin-like negative regulator of GroEL
MAKPIVDGIEKELKGEAKVIRLSLLSRLGGSVGQRYGIRAVPTIIIFDGNGHVVEQRAGIPNQQQVVQQVHHLLP